MSDLDRQPGEPLRDWAQRKMAADRDQIAQIKSRFMQDQREDYLADNAVMLRDEALYKNGYNREGSPWDAEAEGREAKTIPAADYDKMLSGEKALPDAITQKDLGKSATSLGDLFTTRLKNTLEESTDRQPKATTSQPGVIAPDDSATDPRMLIDPENLRDKSGLLNASHETSQIEPLGGSPLQFFQLLLSILSLAEQQRAQGTAPPGPDSRPQPLKI